MASKCIIVLIIEDNSEDVELLRRYLDQLRPAEFEIRHARAADDAEKMLADPHVEIILLDYMLGEVTALELLKKLRATGDLRPVIGLSGVGNEKIVRDLMAGGADDYVSKHELNAEKLRHAIDNATQGKLRRILEAENAQLVDELKSERFKLNERNRRLADMYEMAHQFVDNVSHEFRTPLTVIKEFTAIVYEGLAGPINSEQSEYLSHVLERGDDLATMIDDMLDISKLEAGMFGIARRPCSVAEFVERVRKTLERKAASNHMQFQVSVPENLPEIFGDAEKISRIIINLGINAFKFSSEGAKVSLQARVDGETVRFSITDNGPGIESERIAMIFDRFQEFGGEARAGSKGFGLGLNIVRELVHLHFGDIDVQSKVGKGSTFSFTIPINEPLQIVARYLDRIESMRDGSGFVSFIMARVAEHATPRECIELENFIQHQIRRNDLVFQQQPNQWLLVIAARADETTGLLSSFERAMVDVDRNRPGGELPKLNYEVVGTWHVRKQQREAREAFARANAKREPQHA